jgi:hypothetical protein
MHRLWTAVALAAVCCALVTPPARAQIQAYEYVASMAGDDGQHDHYGISVGLADLRAFAGADWDDEVGTAVGAAYVMVEQPLDGSWVIDRKLLPDPEAGYFGCSMAAAADVLIVGSRAEDAGGLGASGAAYVFQPVPDLGWIPVDKLVASDPGAGDELGLSVATDGQLIVVGTPYHYHQFSPDSVGAAYLWERNIATGWQFVTELLPDDGQQGDYFGWAVAVHGDTVAVGAPHEDENGSSAGAVYLFHRNEPTPGAWGQRAKLISGDTGDELGWSVAVGDWILAGAPYYDGTGVAAGAVVAFDRDSGAWMFTEPSPTGFAGDFFGDKVAMVGTRAVIGAWGADPVGAAFVYDYHWTSPNDWIRIATLTPPEVTDIDSFGAAVAIEAGQVLVGEYGFDVTFDGDEGRAHLYRLVEIFGSGFESGGLGDWSAAAALRESLPRPDSRSKRWDR